MLNCFFQLGLKDTPSWGSIKNWVEKCGFNTYNEDKKSMLSEKAYALIVDESMNVGGDKLLAVLGVKAQKATQGALTTEQVRILDMKVRHSSWTAADVSVQLRKATQGSTAPPAYVISDNASNITKAIKDLGLTHVRDASHTVALCIERHYKNEVDFKSFITEIGAARFHENMRSTSHLLPPRQRTDSRFMNLSGTITWAQRMLAHSSKWNADEERVYSFLNKHRLLIKELSIVFGFCDKILFLFRQYGLSSRNAVLVEEACALLNCSCGGRVRLVFEEVAKWVSAEAPKVPNAEGVLHCSSDILESLFGLYKCRRSPNPRDGVRRNILSLPLEARVDTERTSLDCDSRACLENVRLHELISWSSEALTENLTLKRRQFLKAA